MANNLQFPGSQPPNFPKSPNYPIIPGWMPYAMPYAQGLIVNQPHYYPRMTNARRYRRRRPRGQRRASTAWRNPSRNRYRTRIVPKYMRSPSRRPYRRSVTRTRNRKKSLRRTSSRTASRKLVAKKGFHGFKHHLDHIARRRSSNNSSNQKTSRGNASKRGRHRNRRQSKRPIWKARGWSAARPRRARRARSRQSSRNTFGRFKSPEAYKRAVYAKTGKRPGSRTYSTNTVRTSNGRRGRTRTRVSRRGNSTSVYQYASN